MDHLPEACDLNHRSIRWQKQIAHSTAWQQGFTPEHRERGTAIGQLERLPTVRQAPPSDESAFKSADFVAHPCEHYRNVTGL
jgi:hypothetical protein